MYNTYLTTQMFRTKVFLKHTTTILQFPNFWMFTVFTTSRVDPILCYILHQLPRVIFVEVPIPLKKYSVRNITQKNILYD